MVCKFLWVSENLHPLFVKNLVMICCFCLEPIICIRGRTRSAILQTCAIRTTLPLMTTFTLHSGLHINLIYYIWITILPKVSIENEMLKKKRIRAFYINLHLGNRAMSQFSFFKYVQPLCMLFYLSKLNHSCYKCPWNKFAFLLYIF